MSTSMDCVLRTLLGLQMHTSTVPSMDNSGSIWLDDLSCNGNEERLLDCTARSIGSHNCGHHEDVGVVFRYFAA